MSLISFLWKGPKAFDLTPYSPSRPIDYVTYHFEDERDLSDIKRDNDSTRKMKILKDRVLFVDRIEVKLKNPEDIEKVQQVWRQFIRKMKHCALGTLLASLVFNVIGIGYTFRQNSRLVTLVSLISTVVSIAFAFHCVRRAEALVEMILQHDPFEKLKVVDEFRHNTLRYGLLTIDSNAEKLGPFKNQADSFLTDNEKKLLWKEVMTLDEFKKWAEKIRQNPAEEWNSFIEKCVSPLSPSPTAVGKALLRLKTFLNQYKGRNPEPQNVKTFWNEVEKETHLSQETLKAITSSDGSAQTFKDSFSGEADLSTDQITLLHTNALITLTWNFFKRDFYETPFDFEKEYKKLFYGVIFKQKMKTALNADPNNAAYQQLIENQLKTIPDTFSHKKFILECLALEKEHSNFNSINELAQFC